jgi:hypothetical protein
MLLTTYYTNDFFEISCSCPSVIQPGEELQVDLHIIALKSSKLNSIIWNLEGVTNKAIKNDKENLMFLLDVQEGESFDRKITFNTEFGKEGFGEIQMTLDFSIAGEATKTIDWKFWVSVFKKVTAENKKALEDDLRKRLVDVVNARKRNGHIFMADHVRFFSEFLNIEVPDEIAKILNDELLLEEEGLPVNEELFYTIAIGQTQFYGLENLELIYEENCTESDDKFDLDDAREVPASII